MIVPLPPGGIADTLPRTVADKLTARWGQPVIIETRPGAAHHIGAEAATKSEPVSPLSVSDSSASDLIGNMMMLVMKGTASKANSIRMS